MKYLTSILNIMVFLGVGGLGFAFLNYGSLSSGFDHVPGNLGDSRFNSILLEHNYRQWFASLNSSQYWSPTWNFFPVKNTLAYSDNLLGSAPFYSFFRFLNFDILDSFQAWMLTCSVANYLAMFVFLRTLKFKTFESCIGAFLFAFSMPRINQLIHAQMAPQMFSPLALVFLIRYLWGETVRARYINLAGFSVFVSWQLWAGIYLGWLFLFGLALVFLAAVVKSDLRAQMKRRIKEDYKGILIAFFLAAVILIPLFLPYGWVKSEFGGRPYQGVEHNLPTIGSYFWAPEGSFFYSFLNYDFLRRFERMRIFHENHLFAGFVVLIIPFLLFWLRRRRPGFFESGEIDSKRYFYFAAWSFGLMFLLSLYLHHRLTLWFFVFWFIPGADAINAVSRIYFVMLIPLAVLTALILRSLLTYFSRYGKSLAYLIGALIVVENAYLGPMGYKKSDHLNRVSDLKSALTDLGSCSVFLARRREKNIFTHIDAMFVSMQQNIPTVNGYSGHYPRDWDFHDESIANTEMVKNWLRKTNDYGNTEGVCLISLEQPSEQS